MLAVVAPLLVAALEAAPAPLEALPTVPPYAEQVIGGSRLVGVSVSSGIIAAARRITWNPGVSGGIPARTVICQNVVTDQGADPTGAADSSSAFNSAIAACSNDQVVYIPPGTYLLNSTVTIAGNNGNRTLRGAGMGMTVLNLNMSGHGIQVGGVPNAPVVTNVVGSPAKDATIITVQSVTTPSIAVGDYIAIDQINDGVEVINVDEECRTGTSFVAGGQRCLGQITKVTAIAANGGNFDLTVDPPLYHTYSAAQTPQVWEVSQGVTRTDRVGIEDLTVTRIAPTTNCQGTNFDNINFNNTTESWVKGVRSRFVLWRHVNFLRSFRGEVRDSFFDDGMSGTHPTGGCAYGVVVGNRSTAILVENNVFYHLRHSMVVKEGASGSVFGYNYSVSPWQGDNNWLPGDMDAHGSHTHMNLFEGNMASKAYGDDTHGSNSYNTWFRDYIIRDSAAVNANTGGARVVDIEANNSNYNIVGSVLGKDNTQNWTSYDPGATRLTSGAEYVFNFGYPSDGSTTRTDATVVTSTYVHGNFDYLTNTVIWDPSNTIHTLPNSLYLSGKPSFFGSCAWPPFGSDLTPLTGTLPAKAWYDGTNDCAGVPTITAATCSSTDVQAAITAASAGSQTIVQLPAPCSASWPFGSGATGQVALPSTKSITLNGIRHGDMAQISRGASGGTGCINGFQAPCASLLITPGTGFTHRVTGFAFTTTSNYNIWIDAPTDDNNRFVRIDHDSFTSASGNPTHLQWVGWKGLIDHNFMTGSASAELLHLVGTNVDSTVDPSGSPGISNIGWDAVITPGQTNTITLEDNMCWNTGSTSSGSGLSFQQAYMGARFTARFNSVSRCQFNAHGTAGHIGTRWWEVYGNHLHIPTGGANFSQFWTFNAGSGIAALNVRKGGTDTNSGGGKYEVSEQDSTPYPRIWQPGRGRNLNPGSGMVTGSDQTLTPFYEFINTQSSSCYTFNPDGAATCGADSSLGLVLKNRDGYEDVNALNCSPGGPCTQGVGNGLALPNSCTTGVAFWKTDEGGHWNTASATTQNGQLYKCVSTNNFTLYWTPPVYPHTSNVNTIP